MYLDFKQTEQELYSAKFDILENGEIKVGQASIQGWIGGAQGEWNVVYKGRRIFIEPDGDRSFKQTHPNAFHPWRPQMVKEGDKTGPIIGYQYQETVDQGLLKNLFGNEKIRVWVEIDGNAYQEFSVHPSFEDNGKMCFYDQNNILVAIGETPHDVYDGMHTYGIIASDEQYVLPVIIQICKAYAVSGFNPGQKIKKGHEVNSVLTRNKELLAKYDPTFEQQYGKNK